MKHAIYELEGQLEGLLDRFCYCTEAGDVECAAKLAAVADDFAQALVVLKENTNQHTGIDSII